MDQAAIQDVFRRFAAPLSSFVALGGQREAAAQLARNLWVAMLCGPAAEEELWNELRQVDSALLENLKSCYEHDMRAAVSAQEMQRLRQYYGIVPPGE